MRTRRLLKWVTIALLGLILLVFAAAYVYAHVAGPWASADIIPIPANGTLIKEHNDADADYHYRLLFYKTVGTLDSVRQDYVAHGIAMSPLSDKLTEEDTKTCSLHIDVTKHSRYMLLFDAAFVSLRPGLGYYEVLPQCFYVCAYEAPIETQPDLAGENISLSDNEIAVAIRQCWPNW